jgi:protein-disulfide isomerase
MALLRAITIIGALAATTFCQAPASGKTRGVASAPVTIEIYSDFQCPACKNLHDSVIKPLTKDYVDTGKVFLIHREFPLPMHSYAREAAALATAAGRVGKYDAVADALFARQDEWSKSGQVAAAALAPLTRQEAQKVQALAKTQDVLAAVEGDAQKGRAAGIHQTPTMLITHKGTPYPISGGVSYSILRRFLDERTK